MRFLLLFILFTLTPKPPAGQAVSLEWLTPTKHDFGDIARGNPVTAVFEFHNTGGTPLSIDNVRPSCGCTTPDWPRTPVPADSTAQISVVYSAKMPGYFYKQIKVYFGGRRKAEKLYVKGYVE